jgi:hypothetical protein
MNNKYREITNKISIRNEIPEANEAVRVHKSTNSSDTPVTLKILSFAEASYPLILNYCTITSVII